MSKSFIKKITFVLVFTFFFQVNSGLILALSNENKIIKETKTNTYLLQDKITELLKYNYVSENNKNRENIKKLLELSFDEIKIKLDFIEQNITLFSKENEEIFYVFKNKEIMNSSINYIGISENKTSVWTIIGVVFTILATTINVIDFTEEKWSESEKQSDGTTLHLKYKKTRTTNEVTEEIEKELTLENAKTGEIKSAFEYLTRTEIVIEESDPELYESYLSTPGTDQPMDPNDMPRIYDK